MCNQDCNSDSKVSLICIYVDIYNIINIEKCELLVSK